jgi:hypothetical protein
MRIRIFVATLAATGALIALAGCSTTQPVAIPTPFVTTTPAPVVTPTVTPTPTPTPTPTAKPRLASLVVSADGIDSLVMGQPVKPTAGGFALVTFNADHCNRPGQPGDAGWDTNFSGRSFTIATKPSTATGGIQTILVGSNKLATSTGIRIGSTLAQLKAAYGSFDRVITQPSTTLYVIKGTHGQLAFEVARQITFGSGTPYWDADQVDKVQFLSIWNLSTTPRAFSGTDGAPGSCA